MKKLLLLSILIGVFMTGSAFATPQPCDVYGGYDPYASPTFWYLTDYLGYTLENGDCVCAYWVGPDSTADGPNTSDAPNAANDDSLVICDQIYYGGFFFTVTTWGLGEGHPALGEEIYMVIYDGPCGSLDASNYYGMSDTYPVQNTLGEIWFCSSFPGDPGGGYTDEPLPVELMSFEAIARDGEILLEWRTASEHNALGFYIERDDERITNDLIPAAGNSTTEQTYTYVDKELTNGVTYSYNVIAVDIDGVEMVANEAPVLGTPMANVPAAFALHQNYPNPFNPVTEIKYDLAEDVHVTLKVYNILGAEIATLVDTDQAASYYAVQWDARDLAAGVYFCSLDAGNYKAVKKMVLLK